MFTSPSAKIFELARKLNLFFILLFIIGTSTTLSAHAVQTAWCWAPDGESVRVYIEHWHGPGQNVDCGAGATINVSVAINGGSPITYNNIPFNENIPGTLATLPHDDRLPIQVISTCSEANTENDWGSWDFPLPEGLCPEGGSIQITVLSANDCVFEEACSELYPASTNTVIIPADCPCGPGLPGTDADGDGWIAECDCDDNNPNVNPGVDEVCGNGIDDDCDGVIDTDDDDGDGFGACNGDCDDDNPTIYPGAPELCDALDNDCDGVIPSTEVDADGDGFACDDCDDNNPSVYPLAPEICDGLDNDCDGLVDNVGDQDGDGFSFCDDCDDLDPTVYPGAPELCDGIDNDCDGTDPSNELYDADGDGYSVCQGDCDDADPALNPGATEILGNEIDDDCDGLIDVLPYCTPAINSPCAYMWITNVTLEDLNNTTACDGYASYYTGMSATVLPGGTYSISVSVANYTQYVSVYVDWNLDGDFLDAGENVVNNTLVYYYTPGTASISVPANATGKFTMRVISSYNYIYDACNSVYGEVEDYAINSCDDPDGDLVCGADDNCPNDANTDQIDTDNDGIGDACDDDDDNDGINDADEITCGSDPLNAASTCEVCDGVDNDLNDGIDEGYTDTDGDSMADCVDPDDDNDGVLDGDDNDPLDNFVCQDLDGDGCDDCASGTVDASNDGTDTDGDGLCDLGDPDDDNDGIDDVCDSEPLINNFIFTGVADLPESWTCPTNGNNEKVLMCHIPPGNPENAHTICVSANSVQAHLDHGCMLGDCISCGSTNYMINPNGNNISSTKHGVTELEVFPNPATDVVDIHLHGTDLVNAQIIIYDNLGRVVFQRNLEEDQTTLELDLSNNIYKSGVYIVSMISEGKSISKRLVITK